MNETRETTERFAELIWRTVKLRTSLLIAAAVVLLVTWSGLTNGNIEAAKLDLEFCRHLEQEATDLLKNLSPKGSEKSDQIQVCTNEYARFYIEGGRTFDSVLPLEGKASEKRRAELAEYDRMRKDAYRLEIGLSSQGADSKIIVNALSVAEVVPFIVVLILAVVTLLGFQQNAYRHHLRSQLRDVKSETERNVAVAGTQFLSGLDVNKDSHKKTWMLLSPEGTAIAVLLSAVSYLLLAVLTAFTINLIHRTGSIFFNYLSALFAATFLSVIALQQTRRRYLQDTQRRESKKHASVFRATAMGWLENPWCVYVLIVISVFSVFLPWTTSFGAIGNLKGYNFILNQKSVFESHAHRQYPVNPTLFLEIRLQLTIVALFFLSCLVFSFLKSKPETLLARTFRRVNRLFAFMTIFLALNYVIYMGTLEYGAITNTDFESSLITSSLQPDGGFALSWYDPAYGFVIFLLGCLGLAWISLRSEAKP